MLDSLSVTSCDGVQTQRILSRPAQQMLKRPLPISVDGNMGAQWKWDHAPGGQLPSKISDVCNWCQISGAYPGGFAFCSLFPLY